MTRYITETAATPELVVTSSVVYKEPATYIFTRTIQVKQTVFTPDAYGQLQRSYITVEVFCALV